jgi:nitrate reductase delta subunit
MRIIKAIAVLMDYPSAELQANAGELREAIEEIEGFDPATEQGLVNLVERIRHQDLLDAQAEYVGLFDRSKSLSLHLFEHVHGESRDRGAAMVDLQNIYAEHGLEIDANELPDYVPLFLEFCSRLEFEAVQDWMAEIGHLLQTLHGRLVERDSDYQWLFKALLEIGGLETADEQLQRQLAEETPDYTAEALDAVWAEEPVEFGPGGSGCGGAKTNSGQTVPIDTSNIERRKARQ